jgi:hypothetical protein
MVRIKHFGVTSKLLSWLLNQRPMGKTYMDKWKWRSCWNLHWIKNKRFIIVVKKIRNEDDKP